MVPPSAALVSAPIGIANATRGLSALLQPSSFAHHKGRSGRLAVIGGSADYSGAPYLAAMSALRVGCDLSTIICPPSAALAIKSYSPDIVVRSFDEEDETNVDALLAVLRTCHAIVIGPGMGASSTAVWRCRHLVTLLTEDPSLAHIPVVLDACALKAICSPRVAPFPLVPIALTRTSASSSSATAPFVLTPNANELKFLYDAALRTLGGSPPTTPHVHEQLQLIARAFCATVVLKGPVDVVATDSELLYCTPPPPEASPSTGESTALPWAQGAPRRAAGQGDVFCGVMGAVLAFRMLCETHAETSTSVVDAIAAASAIVKRAAHMVYHQPGGSTYIASDLIRSLGLMREQFQSEVGQS